MTLIRKDPVIWESRHRGNLNRKTKAYRGWARIKDKENFIAAGLRRIVLNLESSGAAKIGFMRVHTEVPNWELRWQKVGALLIFFFSVSAGLVVCTAVESKGTV
jgi:hypothetical protein